MRFVFAHSAAARGMRGRCRFFRKKDGGWEVSGSTWVGSLWPPGRPRGRRHGVAAGCPHGELAHEYTGNESHPFVPPSGVHFTRALEFFATLGFEKIWQHEKLAGLRFGGAYFILQDIDVPEWQTNQMITFEVTDLDAYWSELEAKGLSDLFPK